MAESFAQFEGRMRAQGYDEVLERRWEPGQVVATHSHPFDAQAVVVQGELWLSVGEATAHIVPGGGFEIGRGTPHAERYGNEGATFWVARRH
jgi:quercetin dioxygenase-like cupin family protein